MAAIYRRMIGEGAIVIDVGANIGAHSLVIAKCVGPGGRVVAIEPTAYACQRLSEQIGLNPNYAPRITMVQAMLMGTKQAPLVDLVESSWPLEDSDDAHPQHAGIAKPTTGAKVSTVDDIVLDLQLPAVNFIKIDVDGYEIEVLRGARNTLQKSRPIVFFEYAPYLLVGKGYDPSEIAEIFTSARYSITDTKGRSYSTDQSGWPTTEAGASINLIASPG